jgi:hypothetical protein
MARKKSAMWAGITRVAGFEDSDSTELAEVLSDEAHGLCCQPLKVRLASEVRSTTRTLAKAEGRERSAL